MSKTLSALRKLFAAVLAALSTLALVSIPAQAAVIYQDDFSGLSTDALNGQAPDIRPGSETWVAGSEWKADGTVTATNNDNSAFLAFTPTAGNIYTLSATFTQPSGGNSNGWAGIGFTDTNTTTSSFWANDAAPWFLWRPSDASSADQVVSFLGTGTSGSASEGTQTGTATLSIVLNTENPAWTAEWFINGGSVRTETYGTNPTLNYVGFGRENGQTTDFSAFSLTVVPEPSSALLVALGGLALLRRRRA